MADRLLVFGNPEVRKLLKEKFVTVTGDDWYQRQKKGDEGAYYQKIVKQGPREGAGTRQGHYVFTAQGELLGFNNNRGAECRLVMMKEALRKFEALPEEKRVGGIPDAAAGKDDFDRDFPEGAQVVKVFTRALDREGEGFVALGADQVGNQAAVDHLWLRKDEIAELQKLLADGGGDFPEWFLKRVARFHLRDNTRGEPENWGQNDLRILELAVTATGEVSGRFELQKKEGKLGFEGAIKGVMSFGKDGRLKEFQWLVLGEQWGDGTYTRGSRPGKTPLGQVFQLTDASEPRDQIPPQGIRWEQGYWEAQN